MMEWLAWLEQLPAIAAVRNSATLYPLVLTSHIIGFALLFGATAVTSVRLLLPTAPLPTSLKLSARLSLIGFVAAVFSGAVLFAVDATDYALNTAFQAKMILIVLAAFNALSYELVARSRPHQPAPPTLRKLIAISALALWTGAIVAGRWIAY
jgi:hypothetical protein